MAEVERHRGVFSRRSPSEIIARRAVPFNHLIGAHEQRIGHGEAESLCGLEIESIAASSPLSRVALPPAAIPRL